MATEIKQQSRWTESSALETKKLALKEAVKRQVLADKRYFNKPGRTCDIEQEVQALDSNTGRPIDVQDYFSTNSIGARPDTTVFNIEFDANGITSLTADGILSLYKSMTRRTQQIQAGLRGLKPDTIIVPIGLQPFSTSEEARDLIVKDEIKRKRYDLMEKRTLEENPIKIIRVVNPKTGKELIEPASNLTAMTRCSGTQIHISDCTIKDALQTHNILIAVTPIMVALFGNSIFAGGMDTGRVNTRIELLRQAEQLRAGLPLPAFSLLEYYQNQLRNTLPPFIELHNPALALDLAHSAIHTTSRIRVDIENGTVRNEIRQIDSQSPFTTIQALVLTFGAIEGLRNHVLPSFEQSKTNFQKAVFGLYAPLQWGKRTTTIQDAAVSLIQLARESLKKRGMKLLSKDFLDPLESDILIGISQGNSIRKIVRKLIKEGYSRQEAIIVVLNKLNRQALQA
ncbi:hypothetical protein A3A46_00340 [Candidatus Roizmanbacteria bacterium RIFCSPLOWO2_01_FULL_37_13]|uniref:Glutamate--cysteine ligase n=1 Tax=Candidatus Roizmanbacteria bacterium RIFCSPHIGHO2_02_FULL_38_11 TaxID=1802039 RepID=A0A1F7H4N1_9BACT|nr:MAG: hypothetical protein A3C25_02975 [Candidatus Roizmanbacteria bacterium RIFCSPHIGHO2_02_FULL_38_11]OGK34431.1 MAG: hypothetical protein A3F58_01855 [Candidatus Roizmanbacteria bacterium RIFCSPHIGHO2_12_FULL_37_9b]OGK42343.1 MAG: hypothetical protein A3A46_00340 [Candidatus Roizmanbacteria bacterium RIFCSPLOWO2_01_FULL_37_13]